MKVFILTEGGKNIGFGHIARCLALYQCFEKKNIPTEFLISGDSLVHNILKEKKYRIFNWLKEQKDTFEVIKKASIVIVDSYKAHYGFYKKISNAIKTPVYIDDNKRLDFPSGIVLNGSIDAENINYPRRKNMTYMLGTRYIPVRKEFWNVPPRMVKDSVKNILLTFGGDDKKNATCVILKFLKNKYPALTKNVIVGKAFRNKDKIEALCDEKTNLLYNPDTKGMKKIMLNSDIAISAGGQTLHELARTGTPTVGICAAQNQLRNLLGWRRVGFLEYAGWHNSKDLLGALRNAIRKLGSPEERKKRSKRGTRYMDGKGAARVVDSLIRTGKRCQR